MSRDFWERSSWYSLIIFCYYYPRCLPEPTEWNWETSAQRFASSWSGKTAIGLILLECLWKCARNAQLETTKQPVSESLDRKHEGFYSLPDYQWRWYQLKKLCKDDR
jgi:hypothetical protein